MSSFEKQSEIVATVEIPTQFAKYIPAILMKSCTQYPLYNFAEDSGAVIVHGPVGIEQDVFRKLILHAVYREKIYEETLSMRQALVAAVTGR